MSPELTKEMKIIQFSVKLDKFTGFFDKFLKMNDGNNKVIISCISIGYENRLKKIMNIFPNFVE